MPIRMVSCLTSLVILCGVAAAALAAAPGDATSTAAAPTRIEYYGLGYRGQSDFRTLMLVPEFRPFAFRDRAWLDLEFAGPFEVYRRRGEDRLRFAPDPLIAVGSMLPYVLAAGLYPASEPYVRPFAYAMLPAWLPFVHPTLVVRPAPAVGLVLGWDAAYVFAGDDRGVVFEPRLGLRLDGARRFRLEGGINHGGFWNWRRANEGFGWGWYVRASLSTDIVGGAELPPSYD